MQFFQHQDQARGRTTLLVVLFGLAVLILVAAASVSTHFALGMDVEPGEPYSRHHWSVVATAGIATLGVIFIGSAYRTAQLGRGGAQVAETLGGTLVTAQSQDLLERRLVNVVDEMAIAAGLPAPPVYVLRRENGINAFAAGWSPDDAVIGVTKGALEALTRDQLQGVVAHEFSHILNRDCALNMRLLGILHGIVLISVIGRTLIRFGSSSRSSSSKNSGAHFALVGFAVWLFGAIGVLAARLIQAAVSRQREFLADASAVQFTRNPEGIAGALATIASQTSELSTPRAGETSHMLISEPGQSSFLGTLDSHPSLFERIQRILPRWNGEFASLATRAGSVRRRLEQGQAELASGLSEVSGFSPFAGGERTNEPDALVVQAARLLDSVPAELLEAARQPFSTRALLLAWILDANEGGRSTQLALMGADRALLEETERLARGLEHLNKNAVLPLFDVALGTLSALSEPQKKTFAGMLSAVAAQLSPESYRGYCLAALALRRLGAKDTRKDRPLLVKEGIEVTLAILAFEGHDHAEDARAAFLQGIDRLGPRGRHLRLPDRQSLTIHRLDRALSTLLRLPTVTRASILDAAEFIAAADGVVRPSEAELLRTLATCLGVAVPPAFATGI